MHRPETVSAVFGVAGGRSRHRGWPQVSGGRARRHEVHDQKVRQTADPVDKQPFPQAQRQTGDTALTYMYITKIHGLIKMSTRKYRYRCSVMVPRTRLFCNRYLLRVLLAHFLLHPIGTFFFLSRLMCVNK